MRHNTFLGASALLGASAVWLGVTAVGADAGGPVENFETGAGTVTPGEGFAVKVDVLGAAITYGGDYDMMVTTTVFVSGDRMDLFGDMLDAEAGNVNDGKTHGCVVPNTYDAGETIRVAARSWKKSRNGWSEYLTVWEPEDTDQVIVLRDGDAVPDIEPFQNQANVVDFLEGYIDAESGTVTLEPHQAIYLFELGTTDLKSSAADFQDLVVLVSLATDPSWFGGERTRKIVTPEITGLYD